LILGVCEAAISGPLQLSPNGAQLVEACPGDAKLEPPEWRTDARLALPVNAGRIDIQRLAPDLAGRRRFFPIAGTAKPSVRWADAGR
jgi:hypothetical protein